MVVPAPGGAVSPLVLAAAKLAGVDEIFRVGGAQAIAALAYGTETIAPVAKIVGPGNAYVAAAKRIVFGKVGIDMIAGPVRGPDPRRQDRQSGLDRRRSPGPGRARRERAGDPRSPTTRRLPPRSSARSTPSSRRCRAEKSPARRGATSAPSFWCANSTTRCRSSTPSRPSISRSPPPMPNGSPARIRNAGAIFIGAHTPEAIGDYVAGSNHVLPTARSARFSSGLGVLDFMKRTSILKCGPEQLRALGRRRDRARRGRGPRRPCPLGRHPAQPLMARGATTARESRPPRGGDARRSLRSGGRAATSSTSARSRSTISRGQQLSAARP